MKTFSVYRLCMQCKKYICAKTVNYLQKVKVNIKKILIKNQDNFIQKREPLLPPVHL